MQPLIYRNLVPWYRLVDAAADHLEEAAAFESALGYASAASHG
jgi:hypothetical protein